MTKVKFPLQSARWLAFARERKFSLIALSVTLSVLVGLTFGPNRVLEEQAMAQHYKLSLAQGQVLYVALSLVSFCAFLFGPRFRIYLSNPILVGIILLLALISSFAIVRLTAPDVGFHLGLYPSRIWWIIAGIVILNGLIILAVGFASRLSSKWIYRSTFLLVVVAGCVLVAIHLVSIGRYKNIEDFDEPWMANIATNYAQYGTMDSNFGGPQGDLFSPRYYMLMGLWLRFVGQSDLVALRAFPTLVGLLTVFLVAVFLFLVPSLNHLQRVIGLIVMLGSMPFLWSSHNLRPEIGLATYSAIVLITAYYFFNNRNASRWWLFLMGLSLYVGLETIPTYTIAFAFAISLIVIVHAFRWSLKHLAWREVGAYLIGCIAGSGLYAVIHFWPISRLDNLSLYLEIYSFTNTGRFLTPKWLLNGLSLMNAISPIEIILVVGLLIFFIWRVRGTDRWIAAIFLAAIITAFFPWSATVGYLAMLAPFAAYAAAQLSRTRTAAVVMCFVLLPAFISMPIFDVMDYVTKDQNLSFVNNAALLSDKIPEGSTIVGHDQLWYMLHTNRTFIGWPGVRIAAAINKSDFIQAVKWYKPDFVICQLDSPEYQFVSLSDSFEALDEVAIQDQKFVVFRPVG